MGYTFNSCIVGCLFSTTTLYLHRLHPKSLTHHTAIKIGLIAQLRIVEYFRVKSNAFLKGVSKFLHACSKLAPLYPHEQSSARWSALLLSKMCCSSVDCLHGLHRTKWALAFVCFSFFLYLLFLVTRADHIQLLSPRYFFIVSYIVSYLSSWKMPVM